MTGCIIDDDTPPPAPVDGTLLPKYVILSVIYAPPGTQGGRSSSSVTYGSGSTTGTTVSAQNGFKQNYSVSVEASSGVIGSLLGGGSVSANFGYTRNASDQHSLELRKSATTQISVPGPGSDGINHDHDMIWLWLNPKINATATPDALSWTVDPSVVADIQYVYVGHLKNPALMPPGVSQRLAQYGIGGQDFATILQADPFANGSTTIDPARYKQLFTTFPYEPPYSAADPVPSFSFSAQSQQTTSQSATVSNEYTVGLSVTAKQSFVDIVNLQEKVSGQWTWTSTDTSSVSAGSTESASVTVGGPAFGYTGPTDIAVYYDVLYKSFMFAPVTTTLRSLQGKLQRLTKRDSAPAGTEVTLDVNGVTYRTFTDLQGNYRFPGIISGTGNLKVNGRSYVVPSLSAGRSFDVGIER